MGARLTWLGHATALIEVAGVRLLTDPLLRARVAHLVRHGPVPRLPADLDAVLLSHMHCDHADWPTLRRIPAEVPVIAPRGTARLLRRAGRSDVREVVVGDVVPIAADVGVRAVPARHDGRRWPIGHARSDALGYVIESQARIYFAGDTALYDGMSRIGDGGLDAALLPVWGWGLSAGVGHLDPDGAAQAVARLRPRIAIPIHWATYLPMGFGRTHRHLLQTPGPAFATRVAQVAPQVRTAILTPGAALDLQPAVSRSS